MNVVDINGRFLTQAVTGVQRYATQLVQALDRRLAEDAGLRSRYRLRLVRPRTPEQQALSLSHIPVVPAGRLRGHAWEQLELPAHARGRVLLNLCNTAPLVGRTIVTIHDASVFAVPEAYSPAFRTWYRTLLPLLGTRALRVVTVSKFSREELSRRAGISADKVDVIPLGAEHILDSPADPAVLNRLPVEPGRYILAVGSQSPHKNLQAVTTAIAQLGSEGPPLVLAGAANRRIFAGSTRNGGPIHAVGYVTDGQLRALYEHALCFVFPSWYEGFGLPPLEAMACGCPTVVSDSASLPEVCGDAALYCNARRPDELASRLRVLIREPATRQEFQHRGKARARMFTWERASTRFLDLLDRTCSA